MAARCGRPAAPDRFLSFYAAGRATLAGDAAGLYDPAFAKAAQVAALGRDFAGSYAWTYPPPFLLVTALLSLLALVPAQLAWTGVTLVLYAITAAAVAGWRGLAVALALPAALATLLVGQNGFLTASLFGSALLLLPRRPALGGILIGLLAVKPQLGIVVPLALAAGGAWRVFAAAAATVLAMSLLSLTILGPEAWRAFLHALPEAQASLLDEGVMGFAKLQSAYGLARALGGGAAAAWALQAVIALPAAAVVAALWRSRAPFDLKAAGLVAASLLVRPTSMPTTSSSSRCRSPSLPGRASIAPSSRSSPGPPWRSSSIRPSGPRAASPRRSSRRPWWHDAPRTSPGRPTRRPSKIPLRRRRCSAKLSRARGTP